MHAWSGCHVRRFVLTRSCLRNSGDSDGALRCSPSSGCYPRAVSVEKLECFADDTQTDTDRQRTIGRSPLVFAPQFFVALECDRSAAGVTRHSLANIDRVVVGRGPVRSSERLFDHGVRTLRVFLPDRRMSSQHLCIEREGIAFMVQDLGSRNGTRVNRAQAAAPTPLEDGDLVEAGHTLFRYRAAVATPVGEPADVDLETADGAHALGTLDAVLARQALALDRVARSQVPVLLLGETGTGKEVLARAVHRLSERKGAFVPVNCGALPATLVEAQLFGHVRGSFSGALADAPGLLRSADHGTLLLDEIGDLPAAAQASLLRALQEHEVLPVGGVRATKVDLRVVAATHRPLEKLVERGEFRQDLFARLAGFTFSLPPLRDRRDDIGWLIAAFARERAVRLTPLAGRALLQYDWPLNVRELHRVLEVAAALAGGEALDLAHLPPEVAGASASSGRAEGGRRVPSDDAIREQLMASLARHGGNVSEVARDLGKARMQVQRWLKRFGIDARTYRAS